MIQPVLGLVILNYNDFEETAGLLQHVLHFSAIEHIVVVDNCSNDDSRIKLNAIQDGTWDLICAEVNRGYAAGNNMGIRFLIDKYKVDLVGISNPDVAFSNRFIEKIKKDFMDYPDYSIITGLQYNRFNKLFYHAFWRERSFLTSCFDIIEMYPVIGRVVEMGRLFDRYVEKTVSRHTAVFETDVVGGALFFAKAEDLDAVGGFDEGTFLYYEEDIMAKRLKAKGRKIGIDPSIQFMHKGAGSINKNTGVLRKREALLESQAYFVKNYVTDNPMAIGLLRILAIVYLLILPTAEKLYHLIIDMFRQK